MLKTNSITPLSKRDLNEIAPSIFTTVPSPEVTDKYTHIPTEKVIDDMELLGWLPVEAKEVKARTKDTSCLLYTSPSPRDRTRSRMPSSA